jgi:hypothetical protein
MSALSKTRNPLSWFLSHTMTSTTPDLGHAVGPNGALKDASEIVWTYDEDESIPFPSGSGVHPPSSGGHAPAMMVAGTRRTTRIHRPSQRALEAVEASSSSSASIRPGVKCKAQRDPAPEHRVTRKVVIDSDADDVVADSSDDGATTEPATEPADDDDYESIKAMADADNQVRTPSSLLNGLLTHFSGFNLQNPSQSYS